MMTMNGRTMNDSILLSCSNHSVKNCCKKESSFSTKRGILKRNSVTEEEQEEFAADYSRKSIGSNSEALSCSSSVSFDSITIREYGVTIGDNPACSSGAPISIDWCYGKQVTVPVEYYESVKPPRREKNQMKIPSEARFEILQNWDYSVYKISRASEEAQRERELRNKSVKAFARRDRLRRGLHGLLSYPLALFEGMRHHEQQKQQHSCAAADADFSNEEEDGDKMNNNNLLLVHHPEDSCLKEEEQPSDQQPSRSIAHRHIPQGDRHQQNNKDDDDALSYTHHDHALLLS